MSRHLAWARRLTLLSALALAFWEPTTYLLEVFEVIPPVEDTSPSPRRQRASLYKESL